MVSSPTETGRAVTLTEGICASADSKRNRGDLPHHLPGLCRRFCLAPEEPTPFLKKNALAQVQPRGLAHPPKPRGGGRRPLVSSRRLEEGPPLEMESPRPERPPGPAAPRRRGQPFRLFSLAGRPKRASHPAGDGDPGRGGQIRPPRPFLRPGTSPLSPG